MKLLSAALVAIGLAFAPLPLYAEEYPSKPVKLVVGYPPGGPTDIIGRIIGQNLSKELGKPVIIENQGGGGGVVAAASVAKAKPDGYTLHVSVEASQTRGLALNPTLAYDQAKDFSFIRKVAKQRSLVVVHPSVPVSDIKELLALLRSKPGELNFSGTFGTSSHIVGSLFEMDNDVKMTFINYPGGAQPIVDLIAGTVQVGFFTEGTVAQHINAGKLKALAIAADERTATYPNLPTVVEAGGKMTDASPWFGVVGPKGLSPEIKSKLGESLDRIVVSSEFLSQLETIGAVPIMGSTAESFEAQVATEIAFWNKWTKDIKAPLSR